VIFTDNGIVLRGGKLLTKESATEKERKRLTDYPVVSKKVAKLQLKKFPQKKVSVTEKIPNIIYDNATLKYIIEYSVNSITNPTTLNFYLIQVTSEYEYLLKSNSFTEFKVIPSGTTRLLNSDDTTITPTWSYDLTTISDWSSMNISGKVSDIYSEIRTYR
jgi:phosphoribosyl-dephospho-CoA transferase